MVRLNSFLTIHCHAFLILTGCLLGSLLPSGSVAQDGTRLDKSLSESGQRKQSDRKDSDRWRAATDKERRGRFSGNRDNRRSEFKDSEQIALPRYFPEGDFESPEVETGFVFIDGKFLPGPYIFRSAGKSTFVNDAAIADGLVDITSVPDFDDEGQKRGRRRESPGIQKTYAEFLSEQFSQSRQVLLVFAGSSPKLLARSNGGNDLLSVLVSEAHRSTLLPRLLSFAGSSETTAKWYQWIINFQPDEAFLASAQPIVDKIDATFEESVSRHAAIRRFESWTYPLTIAGMIMSVFAIGHLMSNPPNGGKRPDEIERSPEVIQIVTRSLGLVVALSMLDLIWTLLASQAGTMRELNPVGGRLIDDPAKLIVFKVAMTALAAGLIFKLRYYRRAQQASWWACLILTLLTVRWLTFNSMLA